MQGREGKAYRHYETTVLRDKIKLLNVLPMRQAGVEMAWDHLKASLLTDDDLGTRHFWWFIFMSLSGHGQLQNAPACACSKDPGIHGRLRVSFIFTR